MKRFAPLLLAAAAPLALTACDTMGSNVAAYECTQESQSECLAAFFEEKWQEELARSPITQTGLGLKTSYDQLDDFSLEATEAEIAWWQDAAAQMEASFDYDELSEDDKLSYDMFKWRAEQAALAGEWMGTEYVFTQMQGFHTGLPNFLLSQHRVDDESDMVAFIARIGQMGRVMDQLLERTQANAEAGVRPPRFAYEAVIAESQGLITGAPFDDGPPSPMWEGVEGHLAALVESGAITEERADELREDARVALVEGMAPGYQHLVDWFTQDMPNSDEVARGASALPNGEAYYAYALQTMTTTDMTADEIHELGLSEVARIHGEMEAIKEQVGFDGTLQEFFEFMRSDPQFFYPDNEAGAQMYLDRATEVIDAMRERLPEFFGTLPQAPLEVRRVEAFREQDGAAQHYQPGTPDGSRPGIYYAHLSDMTSMPVPELETIAYHEGIPGHHMQISIAQELQGVPMFRSQGPFISAFGEGWALYAESLAHEMGGFEDPYSDFGRLQNELWRAIRLVVDTGIHSKGWSEQQAIDYAMENSATSEVSAQSEVRRYIVWPGQATSYKIGMIRIQQLRARAEEALGDDFDIRGFHDVVLGGGNVPLPILEARVDRWIASQQES